MATGVSGTTERDIRAALYSATMRNVLFEDFSGPTIPSVSTVTGGVPTGAAGDVNFLQTSRGNIFQYHVLGTQTILAPVMTTTGLNISQDVANADDGVEYVPTILEMPENTLVGAYGNKGVYTVGTDGPIYTSLKFTIADVSGTDDCAFGFRKLEAFQATVDGYDEAAFLNVISGDINIETLRLSATTTTDTTDNWADAATKTLTVIVALDGKVTYEIDGVAPTTTKAYTFDSGEVIVPFFYFIHAADFAETTNLVRWEAGPTGFGDGFEAVPPRTGGI